MGANDYTLPDGTKVSAGVTDEPVGPIEPMGLDSIGAYTAIPGQALDILKGLGTVAGIGPQDIVNKLIESPETIKWLTENPKQGQEFLRQLFQKLG